MKKTGKVDKEKIRKMKNIVILAEHSTLGLAQVPHLVTVTEKSEL
jgi:hypothetical protein